ncbi:hypothetical protein CGC49_01665 [Capnocytophaga sp. H4358]|nr:hypothetical protein CGC49_01665 [Capnocytophaga sp. H4358]ATA74253.1 hypothetical protein CGC52_01630 [Capnocytophaga sp. H2931]
MWYEKHKAYINEKNINPETGRYWYTHKMLRRSYFTIKRVLPNIFTTWRVLKSQTPPMELKDTSAILKTFGFIKRAYPKK